MRKMVSELVKQCMKMGFLVDKKTSDILNSLGEEESKKIVELASTIEMDERVIDLDFFYKNFEKIKKLFDGEAINPALENILKNRGPKVQGQENKKSGHLRVLFAPSFKKRKIEVEDFVRYFKSRFELISKILEKRNLDNLTSIRRIPKTEGNFTIIASVFDKKVTKNKNILLDVEDLTGRARIVINKNRKDVFEVGQEVLLDDIVAFKVSGNSDILFANEIIYPDAFLEEKRKCDFDEYIAVVSDFHSGSTMFLEENLLRFVHWLNGGSEDEKQREIALKVKYLFIVGDNIDGISQYPGQEKYLIDKTSKDQYLRLSNILKLVRKDVKMMMIPGQHDSVWIGEPQPTITEEWAPSLYEIDNLYLLPNPSLVEIDGGFKILMYHGGSINKFIDEIPRIRTKYKHMRPTIVVREFLKRRHLSPMHGMMDYIPCDTDPLVIRDVPDIVLTGDQHRLEISNYNNILLIASSCWQSITPFEERVGNVPDPCKVPLFNLKTREIKVLDFSGGDS